MRTKQKTPDYGAISRRSIKRDCKRVQMYPERGKRPQIEKYLFVGLRKIKVMKIKSKTGYKIVFFTFLTLTVVSYIWTLFCIISWIFKSLSL